MNTFASAVINQSARTENGMKARESSASGCVDLFFNIGGMRGTDPLPRFFGAYTENFDVAIRTMLWARDVRGGAGERELFRVVLNQLADLEPDVAFKVLLKVPEVGRWDDVLVFEGTSLEKEAFDMIKGALDAGNGLCAKWMPRKGTTAVKLRSHFGWTPKFYRKRLVELTKVVETQMCAKDWENINFNHVPSLASARYKKAFARNSLKYGEYAAALARGEENVKVNADAVYPYDVLKGVVDGTHYGLVEMTKTELDVLTAQWNALPNYIGDANVLPMVDVSGSMACPVGAAKTAKVTCLDVAVSLGLYCADKNAGPFNGTFLTFSEKPQLLHLKGNIVEKMNQMMRSDWEMNTNLHAAIDKILRVAVEGSVPQEQMPAILLVLSDMQFDYCAKFDDSAIQMITRKYEAAGYNMPNVVFWNLNARGTVPVRFDQNGAALVSGFSPAIMTAVLSGDFSQMTPEAVMLNAVMADRYSWQ